jgi:hypothetical protein
MIFSHVRCARVEQSKRGWKRQSVLLDFSGEEDSELVRTGAFHYVIGMLDAVSARGTRAHANHDHAQAHDRHAPHANPAHDHAPHAHPPAPARFSLLRLSLARRVLIAVALVALIWGGVAWALL